MMIRKLISEMIEQEETAYHVAPTFVRSSITKFGLDPSKSEYQSSNNVYLFKDLNEAKWYRETYSRMGGDYTPMDIWVVNVKGLKLIKDYGLSSDPNSNDESTAHYHVGRIPKGRVKLLGRIVK